MSAMQFIDTEITYMRREFLNLTFKINYISELFSSQNKTFFNVSCDRRSRLDLYRKYIR